MKSATNSPSNCVTATLLALLISLLVAACSTVTPRVIEAPAASWDGGQQNSGFLGWTNVDDMTVGIITPNALARYNGLIARYGKRFMPPLNPSEGVCTTCRPNLILIQAQDLAHFATMNRWAKAAVQTP